MHGPAKRLPSRPDASSVTNSVLQTKASPFSSGVTLYELKQEVKEDGSTVESTASSTQTQLKVEGVKEEVEAEPSGEPLLRRSARKRTRVMRQDSLSDLTDIEDMAYSPTPSASKRAARASVKDTPRAPRKPTEAETSTSANSKASPSRKRVPSSLKKTKSPTKRVVKYTLGEPHPAPPRWRETYRLIKHQRNCIQAPVDTMGCHMAGRQETDPRAKRLSVFVSLILSPQTKDTVVDATMIVLREALGGSITLEALLAADEATIKEAIKSVGFWRKKANYLMEMAKRLRDDFSSDVPKTIEDLCSIKGVGEKIGFLTLAAAWDIHTGIGVDTHVHRITQRLGWHNTKPVDEDATRLNLQSWLPRELWDDINHMLVGFGQTICQPIGPRCNECAVGKAKLCPFSLQLSKKEVSKAKARKPLSREDRGRTLEQTLLNDEIEKEQMKVDANLEMELEVEMEVETHC